MATGVNKVILVGNLGQDPEIQTFDNDVKKASFSIATDESYKNREGVKVEKLEWHRVVVWRGLAGVAERYLKKGSKIYLEGRISTRQYDDAQGQKRYITEIEGRNFIMLDRREENSGQSYPPAEKTQPTPAAPETSAPLPEAKPAVADDLPF